MATAALGVATGSASNTNTYQSGSFTPAAGDLLVVFVHGPGTVQNPSTMSSSVGTTFTMVRRTTQAAANSMYCFVADGTSNATAQTVTWNCTGDNATGALIQVILVSGMELVGAQAVRQTQAQASQAAGGTPAPVFGSAALTGNLCLGYVCNTSAPAGMTAPSTWANLNDSNSSTPTAGGSVCEKESGFTGTTVTWGSTSATAFGSMIVELWAGAQTRHRMACGGVGA